MCALFIPKNLQAGAVKGLMHEVMKKTAVKGHLQHRFRRQYFSWNSTCTGQKTDTV